MTHGDERPEFLSGIQEVVNQDTVGSPSRVEFEKVCTELAEGGELTYAMLGRIFGESFWVMLVYSFLDAGDAARAIQGSMNRLSKKGKGKK